MIVIFGLCFTFFFTSKEKRRRWFLKVGFKKYEIKVVKKNNKMFDEIENR